MPLRYPTTLFVFLLVLWIKAIYPPSSGIADTDFFWHLTYGEWMVEHRTIPSGDFFSWTFPGQPYQLTQWLGEYSMGLAYTVAGTTGTKLLAVALAAVTIGFSWKAAERYVHPAMALGVAVVCNLIQIVTPMRPQLYTFALLSVGIWMISGWLATNSRRYLLGYPLLLALWVNLHGGFIVGLVMIGLTALGLSVEDRQAGRSLLNRSAAFVWCMVAASTAATLLNPYGYKAILTVLMIGGLRSSSVISEWMPVNLTTEIGWFYLLNLVPFVALLAIPQARPRFTIGILAGFFLIFGVIANRQVAMCAAVMAPLTSALLARTSQYEQMLLTLSNPSRPLIHLMLSVLLAGAYPSISGYGDTKWASTINNQYPVQATDFLVRNNLTHRVLSDTLEASYLIHRRIPVFIDGRMDLYLDPFFFTWYLAARAAPGWDRLLATYHPEAMLLRHEMAIRQAALAQGSWKQVYEDTHYSILVPSESALASVPPSLPVFLDEKGRLIRPYMP